MYFVNTWKKEYFLITPEEFEAVFKGFSFVSVQGVKQGYVKSDRAELNARYRELFALLASGKRCEWSKDHSILDFNIGVTAHIENCVYAKAGKGLLVPKFKEPCVQTETFCAVPFGSSPTAKGSFIGTSPQYAFGLAMCFPAKITYTQSGETKSFDELADKETWTELRGRIMAIAPMLYIMNNDKKYNTRIRVSPEAKKSLSDFNAVKESGLILL